MEIVAAVLAKSENEMREKIERLRPLDIMVQVDVMDGIFVKNETWAPPSETSRLLKGLPFEAHLMVENPEHAVMVWLAAGAKRVFYHAETTDRHDLIIRSAVGDSDKIGVAINPDTPIARIAPILDEISYVLVMGVNPGWGGQDLLPIAVEKIAAIKRIRPTLTVSVDGGVTPQNAPLLIRAGADILVAGSALTDAADPAAALAEFKTAVKGL